MRAFQLIPAGYRCAILLAPSVRRDIRLRWRASHCGELALNTTCRHSARCAIPCLIHILHEGLQNELGPRRLRISGGSPLLTEAAPRTGLLDVEDYFCKNSISSRRGTCCLLDVVQSRAAESAESANHASTASSSLCSWYEACDRISVLKRSGVRSGAADASSCAFESCSLRRAALGLLSRQAAHREWKT